MSITANPITAGLMRIQGMERAKRLKSFLHPGKRRGMKKQSGVILCVRGASCEYVAACRGGRCCRIITRTLSALLWILPEAAPRATDSPAVQNS